MALNLEPVFASIDDYAVQIDAAVRRVTELTGQPPLLVAHSMGGLAVRAWMRRFDADNRVHRVVTVGTPHCGTWLARFGHGPNAQEMRMLSPWFNTLATSETSSRQAKFTCYYSHCDNIVFPCSSATLPNADNRHLRGHGHVHLLKQPAILDEVMRLLRE
jgi:triacylglycerol esterase/lipase EstA (alpha/beta hydrolase family)